MIFDLLAPPQGPRGRGQKKSAVAHPIHVSNSHTKFGWISSNCLGGDSVTDRRTDGGDCNIPEAFLKKRGDNDIHRWIYCRQPLIECSLSIYRSMCTEYIDSFGRAPHFTEQLLQQNEYVTPGH